LIRAQHRHHGSARSDQVSQELSCHPFTIHDDLCPWCFACRLFIAGQDRRHPHRQVLVTSMGGGETGMPQLIMQEDQSATAQDLPGVPNQPAWDQRVSVDGLAVPIDVVERLHLLHGSGWWLPQARCPLCEPIREGVRSVSLRDL
jgi:hypothetical protein